MRRTTFQKSKGLQLAMIAGILVFQLANSGVAAGERAAPLGPLPAPPEVNPAQVELGKLLFFENRLSGDDSLSCADCHNPQKGWTDGMPLAEAYPGTLSYRNAPTVLNAAYYKKMFWNGTQGQMDTLVRTHLTGAMFMNSDGRHLEERLRQVPVYQNKWKEAMGTDYIMFGQICNAIAAFVNTLVSKEVPFDQYMRGDKSALPKDARQGLDLFQGKAGCIQCHNGPLLTDQKFHNVGVPPNPDIQGHPLRRVGLRFDNLILGVPDYDTTTLDYGRYIATKIQLDKGKFRTPQLREIRYTSPYMHNGMLKTLEEVVEFYDQGGGPDPFGTKTPFIKPLGLTKKEKRALVAFLESLSSPTQPYQMEKLPRIEYGIRELKTFQFPRDDLAGGGGFGLPFISE